MAVSLGAGFKTGGRPTSRTAAAGPATLPLLIRAVVGEGTCPINMPVAPGLVQLAQGPASIPPFPQLGQVRYLTLCGRFPRYTGAEAVGLLLRRASETPRLDAFR